MDNNLGKNNRTMRRAPLSKVQVPANTTSTLIFGLDLGYEQTKASTEDWSTKFASLVKRRSGLIATGLKDSEGYLVETAEGAWNVGVKGSYDFTTNRLASDSGLPKLLASLGLYQLETGNSTINELVSGLPIDDFKIPGFKEEFMKQLPGTYTFTFENKPISITIDNARVIPQAAGAYFDYVLDDNGELKNDADIQEIAEEDVAVLDIGGKSTDVCIMEAGIFSQDSFTAWKAVAELKKELRKLIARDFEGFNVPLHKIDDALRSSVTNIAGDKANITNQINEAKDICFPAFWDDISLYIPDFRRFAGIILAGGGASLYKDYIEDLAGIPIISIENPEMGNANGYRKYGKSKLIKGDE
jgi:hypothetical protein